MGAIYNDPILVMAYTSHASGSVKTEKRDTYTLTGDTRQISPAWSYDWTYHYDSVGQIERISQTGDPGTQLNRDSNGNAVDDTVIWAGDRLREDSTYTYYYDDEGNVEWKFAKDNQSRWYYVYDHANRLTKVGQQASAGQNQWSTVRTVSFHYDAEGNLLRRWETTFGGGMTHDAEHYVYSHEHITLALDMQQEAKVHYLRGDQVDQIYAQFDVTVAAEHQAGWYVTDRQGTLVEVYNNDNLELWAGLFKNGSRLLATSAVAGVPAPRFQYTGRYWDETIGLQNNRARWFNPSTHRWMSEDPLEFGGGDTNLYRYVFNSSANYTDPSGEIVPIVAVGVSLIIGGLLTANGAAQVSLANYDTAFEQQNRGDWRGFEHYARIAQTSSTIMDAGVVAANIGTVLLGAAALPNAIRTAGFFGYTAIQVGISVADTVVDASLSDRERWNRQGGAAGTFITNFGVNFVTGGTFKSRWVGGAYQIGANALAWSTADAVVHGDNFGQALAYRTIVSAAGQAGFHAVRLTVGGVRHWMREHPRLNPLNWRVSGLPTVPAFNPIYVGPPQSSVHRRKLQELSDAFHKRLAEVQKTFGKPSQQQMLAAVAGKGQRLTLEFDPQRMNRRDFLRKARALQDLARRGKLFNAPEGFSKAIRNPDLSQQYKALLVSRVYEQFGKRTAKKLAKRIQLMQPDHIHELQLYGPDIHANLWLMHAKTNELIGNTIQQQRQMLIRASALKDWDPITDVVIRGI